MDENDRVFFKSVLEAMLLLADKPLTVNQVRKVIQDLKPSEIKTLLWELAAEYRERGSGIELYEVAEGFQFRTRPELAEWVKKYQKIKPLRLSRPAMESLAIIAYKQPLTRGEIEDIRGVDCGGVLKTLLDCRLIRVLGRKKIPGNPLIYGTTKEFLEIFQLQSLADLPYLEEIESLEEVSEQLPLPLAPEADEPLFESPLTGEEEETDVADSGVEASPDDPETQENGETAEGDRGPRGDLPPQSGTDDQ